MVALIVLVCVFLCLSCADLVFASDLWSVVALWGVWISCVVGLLLYSLISLLCGVCVCCLVFSTGVSCAWDSLALWFAGLVIVAVWLR